MTSELVGQTVVDLPIGSVRFTLARHDDGHYSGVAAVVDTGRRIGLLTAGPVADGQAPAPHTLVDVAVAGGEVAIELARLFERSVADQPARIPESVH